MRVEHLYRYPVKGLSAEALEAVTLAAGECVPEDRRFALAQGDAAFDEAAPAFLPKRNFACLMVNERLALVKSAFDARHRRLTLAIPGQPAFEASTTTPEGKAAIAAALTAYLGEEARGTPRFVEAPGHAFADDKVKMLSLLNLASVAEFSARIGQPVDPLRFRANVHFGGLAPWAEFDLVGREVMLGGARLRIVKRIIRCPATQVNPATGERDIKLPLLLRQHYDHADFGIYGLVLEGGPVALGDALEVLPE
ncbi:MOSC domain-containing protein [Roseomonas sp. GC11]|uniref:MOSC domain-containing protein n=1 Tax=Roseomonas sp. GC11 TaxID=2950546 RepID=UPI002108936A|nr:MOSC N-terminal beta barrel domain-containing protein [Roseomonas sp. GC11]MCQ4162742.1 MOSC domain-containing protein [Roseomonas sp. GC11]